MNRRPLRPRCAATGTHRIPAAASGAACHWAHLRRALLTLRLFAGFGGILLTSHCASDAAGRGSGNRDPLVALSRVEITRTIEPRLSIPTAYRPCSAAIPTGGTVPRADCTAAGEDLAPSSAVLDVAQRASARIQANADPDALHAAALIDLIWAGQGRIPLERSVSYLRTASRLASRESGVYADLAAALLVRAERHQTPRDLVEAIEMADVALELEPRNETARFNLALGLERLGLDGQAQSAWKAFLQLDSTSRWAEEARRRARPPAEVPDPPPVPGVDASGPEIAAYVDAAPEAAMLFGWDRALDSWAVAASAGDMRRAESYLSLAARIGDV
jgi:tetratricopeptide (TPR) repeat protein